MNAQFFDDDITNNSLIAQFTMNNAISLNYWQLLIAVALIAQAQSGSCPLAGADSESAILPANVPFPKIISD